MIARLSQAMSTALAWDKFLSNPSKFSFHIKQKSVLSDVDCDQSQCEIHKAFKSSLL